MQLTVSVSVITGVCTAEFVDCFWSAGASRKVEPEAVTALEVAEGTTARAPQTAAPTGVTDSMTVLGVVLVIPSPLVLED